MILKSLKDVDTNLLVEWFDQGPATISKDLYHVQLAVVKCLDNRWIKWFEPYSDGYRNNKSVGNRVNANGNVLAIGDGTLVKYFCLQL